MNHLPATVLVCLSMLLSGPALAQSTDIATERSRLANERIRLEAERRALEEQEAVEQAATQAEDLSAGVQTDVQQHESVEDRQESPGDATGPDAAEVVRTSPRASSDLTQALEQLRTLGELREAGYVTNEEFNRIKQKILDSQF